MVLTIHRDKVCLEISLEYLGLKDTKSLLLVPLKGLVKPRKAFRALTGQRNLSESSGSTIGDKGLISTKSGPGVPADWFFALNSGRNLMKAEPEE